MYVMHPPGVPQLQGTGDKEQLRQLLRKQLEECGWVDAVTQKCRGMPCVVYVSVYTYAVCVHCTYTRGIHIQ